MGKSLDMFALRWEVMVLSDPNSDSTAGAAGCCMKARIILL